MALSTNNAAWDAEVARLGGSIAVVDNFELGNNLNTRWESKISTHFEKHDGRVEDMIARVFTGN